MRRSLLPLVWLFAAAGPALAGEARIQHTLRVSLDPTRHTVEVTDEITVPAGRAKPGFRFLLHAALDVVCKTEGVSVALVEGEPKAGDFGMRAEAFPKTAGVPRKQYVVTFEKAPKGPASFTLQSSS